MSKIDGSNLSNQVIEKIKEKVESFKLKPKLAIIMTGSNPESLLYVNHKVKIANNIGIDVEVVSFDENSNKEQIQNKILNLNNDPLINGIIIQLPLLDNLKKDEFELINSIDPKKDVDGLTFINQGLLEEQKHYFMPATSLGVIKILDSINFNKENLISKNILLIGYSRLVSKPLIKYFLNNNATIKVVNEYSKNWKNDLFNFDIIISSAGKPNLIKNEKLNSNGILIGVGIKKINDKLFGDFDEDVISKKVKWYTPTPGGVGPMTICSLFENVLKAYINQNKNI